MTHPHDDWTPACDYCGDNPATMCPECGPPGVDVFAELAELEAWRDKVDALPI